MKYEAYFLSPDGRVLPVEFKHICTIVDNCSTFGITIKWVKSIYKKHGEPLYSENRAREEIIRELLKAGWVRIRYVPGEDSFTIQVFKLNNRIKANIRRSVNSVTNKTENVPKYTGYELSEIKTNGRVVSGNLRDWQ